MKILIRALLMLLLALPLATLAQPYHRLAARDFAGQPPANNGDIAYTNCYVSYNYDVTRHNGQYNIVFDVRLTMNKNRSYIRLDQVKSREHLLQVLQHEQGHYNMAFLLKCEAYSVLSRHHYTANYQAEIASLFKQVEMKYHRLNDAYEADTEHMTNTNNQEKWNAWFSAQINNVSIADANP